jgi:polysaccharide export outer membrane protein
MSKLKLLLVVLMSLAAICAGWAQNSASNTPPESDYKLGAGDQFRVMVQRHEELSGEYLVPDGGIVVFPQIGTVKVAGSTIAELTRALEKKLDAILIDPSVAVILKSQRSRYVTVIGDVQRPVPASYVPGMRLADAVTAAGGLLPEVKATDCDLTLIHAGSSRTLHLIDVLRDPSNNLPLSPGDTVNVDSGTFTVYVVGQVRSPGLQRLKRGAGIIEAFASAGGGTDASETDNVRITHLDGTEEVVDLTPILLHGEKASLPSLRAGDLILVPTYNARFYVLGYVYAPGIYEIPIGRQITLADAISMAHGHDQERRARMSRVLVSRNEGGKVKSHAYDFGKFLRTGDQANNPVIQSGDIVYVPETSQIPAVTAANVATALATLAVLFRL